MPTGFTVNSTVMGTRVASFQCPSDSSLTLQVTWPTNGHVILTTRGNYVASWGNTVWSQQDSSGGTATRNMPAAFRPSAFGHRSVRLADVSDGTRGTIFTGEVIQGSLNDARGAAWALAGAFISRFTPNGLRDFYGVADGRGHTISRVPGSR
jgi:hypothetical protein